WPARSPGITRANRRLPPLLSHRLPARSWAACRFRTAAIPRWATRREEHQLVLMWRFVRTTRFTDTRGARTADQARDQWHRYRSPKLLLLPSESGYRVGNVAREQLVSQKKTS